MTVTFYLSATPVDDLLEMLSTAFERTEEVPVYFYKHWRLVYGNGKTYYAIHLSTDGVHHDSCDESDETGLQLLFKVETRAGKLRRKLDRHFQDEKYDVCSNNCQHFVMRVIKLVDRLYKVYDKEPLAQKLLQLPVSYCNRVFLTKYMLASSANSDLMSCTVLANCCDSKMKRKLLLCVCIAIVLIL